MASISPEEYEPSEYEASLIAQAITTRFDLPAQAAKVPEEYEASAAVQRNSESLFAKLDGLATQVSSLVVLCADMQGKIDTMAQALEQFSQVSPQELMNLLGAIAK